MPNPPKLDPVRAGRSQGPTRLPAEGRTTGEIPQWPLGDDVSDAELEAWTQLWRTPQAVAWEKLGWTRSVARYCRIMVRSEEPNATPGVLAQVTAMEDRLGLTPKAMRLLLWEIVSDDVADKRAASKSVRDRISAVAS